MFAGVLEMEALYVPIAVLLVGLSCGKPRKRVKNDLLVDLRFLLFWLSIPGVMLCIGGWEIELYGDRLHHGDSWSMGAISALGLDIYLLGLLLAFVECLLILVVAVEACTRFVKARLETTHHKP